jgi:hypothetical protein
VVAASAVAAAGVVAATVVVSSGNGATPMSIAGLEPGVTAGRGADLPFVEYEAENAEFTGRLIGPDRTFTTLAAEASGRQAVMLDRPGQYVEFVLAEPADALTVRHAIPDAEHGGGIDATLGVYLEDERIAELATTSRYSWYYGAYPFSSDPSDGSPHHFYAEARVLLGRTVPAGAAVRLMVGPEDGAAWYAIDVADFELVGAPYDAPDHAIDVSVLGADPTGAVEASDVFDAAIDVARRERRPVWIPPGEYLITRHLLVDDVEIVGAGPWYSVLRGDGVGIYGHTEPEPSSNVILRDFAVIGEVTERDDSASLNGIGGAMGGGSLIENLWIQWTKVGLWFDGPMDGITIRGLRILDQAADGLNFRRGVTNAVVEHTFVRNTGDDALAAWSHLDPNRDIVFRNNTIVAPVLANGIAVYGGRDIQIVDNVVADTLTQGGGIHVGNRFTAVPVGGEIAIEGNTLVRAGVLDPNWNHGVGAVWFYALDFPMTADIVVRDTHVVDATYEAFMFTGSQVSGVTVDGARVDGAGTGVVTLRAAGAAQFTGVEATGLGGPEGVQDCSTGFELDRGEGNVGWDGARCAEPPHSLTAGVLAHEFDAVTADEVGQPLAVEVRNAGDEAVPVASVTAIGQFTATHDCPDILEPGGTCIAEVAFAPTGAGERLGLLVISDGGPAGQARVELSGLGLAASGNAAEGRPVETSSTLPGFLPERITDANPTTYWEGVNEEFPQTVTVDLGVTVAIDTVVLRLPPADAWGSRIQNIEILTSLDGDEFVTAVPPSDLRFDVATDNRVEVDLPHVKASHVRLVFNDNTEWPAAQLAELEVYAS